jgi:hypothetical protein
MQAAESHIAAMFNIGQQGVGLAAGDRILFSVEKCN